MEMAGSEEARSFVASHSRSFLLTRRDSGAPTGHPMTLRVSSAGDLLFNTYRASAKARNLIRRPQVSCLVTTGTDDPDPRWVLVSGTAEVLDRDEGIRAWSTSTGGPAVAVRSPVVGDTVQARLADGKRIVVRLRPERVIGPIRPARGS